MAVVRFGHIGICVASLERALVFWCDLLGFRALTTTEVNDPLSAKLLGLTEVDQTTVFVERDGVRLALFEFRRPALVRAPAPRPVNQPGVAAIMLRVDDLDGTVAKIRAAGFRVLDDTRIEHPTWKSKLLFVCDADDTLVELIEIPGDPYTPFGKPVSR